MELYEQHLHSTFSFDGKSSPLEECHAAIEKNLCGICFTEHFSVDKFDVSFGFMRYEKYHEAIENCKENFGDRLKICRGLEIGEPHLEKCRSVLENELSKMDLDFIIGSIHNIGSVKLRIFRAGKTSEELYAEYFSEILKMVETADFDVIGHLDLVKKYGVSKLGDENFQPPGDYEPARYEKILRKILSRAIERGVGIEINTAGWRTPAHEQYPKIEVLKLYWEMGGELITIGSDAHHVKDIAANFDRAAQILQAVGFEKYFCYFGRQPFPIYF